MDIGNALQQAMLDRAGAYLGLLWLFLAICAGLYASERKRRFWTWVILSLIGGPIAWVRLYRIGYAIPADVAVGPALRQAHSQRHEALPLLQADAGGRQEGRRRRPRPYGGDLAVHGKGHGGQGWQGGRGGASQDRRALNR